jgi:hypothetical protein
LTVVARGKVPSPSSGLLATKSVGPNPTTVLIAGNDADAKAELAGAL